MKSEAVIRNEPGEYRIVARYRNDGGFEVVGESAHPITLTVRVEDAWERMPPDMRRYSYAVTVRRDGCVEPLAVLEDVAPDARIYFDFEKTFEMTFT